MSRFSAPSAALFAVLASALLVLALFPPAARENARASAGALPARRVAIFATAASGYASIDEGPDHILAVSKPAREWILDGLLNHVYPALERIPVSGNTVIPDAEQVLRLWPDAVFVYPGQAGILKEMGLPGVVAIMADPKNPIESREKVWRRMGEIAGKNDRVTALLERYATKRAILRAHIPEGSSRYLRVGYIAPNNGAWLTTNSNHYLAYLLDLAGVRNVGKNLKITGKGDLEQLLISDPDVIVCVFNLGDNTTMKEISGRPEFQALRAVRERRIYRMPVHSYMNQPVEDPLLLMWMAEVFYPDIMPRRLRDEYKETYREVYHYSISDDEIDKAIYLQENRFSAGYDRFVRQETGR